MKAFFLGHLGLGDMITCMPIIRYLRTKYDEVKVHCFEKYLDNCKLIYKDDPGVTFYTVNTLEEISPHYERITTEEFRKIIEGYELYMCGYHFPYRDVSLENHKACFLFYDDLDIDRRVFREYFHLPEYEESKRLYDLVKERNYCLMHGNTSHGHLFDYKEIEKYFGLSKDEVIILDIEKNIYEETHPFYTIAQEFVKQPLVFYKDSLIHAPMLVTTNSCLFCLAVCLPMESEKLYYSSRDKTDYSMVWEDHAFGKKVSKFINLHPNSNAP
jgi:hypothetical protein